MTRAQLVASRALWRRRLTGRQRKVDIVRGQAKQGTGIVTHEEAAQIHKWERLRDEAREMVERRDRQLAAGKPRIITGSSLGLHFQNLFGGLGAELNVTGHHTAGPTDKSDADAIRLCRQYHGEHMAKGWGGIGYHYCITRAGSIIGLRPIALKGAHVGGHNSSNAGIMFHGTVGDKPTEAQHRTYAWLLDNAHARAMPSAHRATRKLRSAKRRGHNDWSGHETNACPGTHKPMIKAGG